ncbi:1-acyl-sn-glycerol-3-phosphate acyltransferase, partial [Oenococcus oeni]|uniref:1-acyl-sn-glycerol-3-phosphate acyltransferase n=1 Tax=Oenococcus oeni TaxID=1247 RepID=UPI00051877E2
MYTVIFRIIQVIRWLINGKTHVYGQENIPQDTQFILVAPHRTWWDPLWFAMTLLPRQFIIMAKKRIV